MQILNRNNSTPVNKQTFERARFLRLSSEARECLLNDKAFSRLAKEYDIFVSASPKRTWKDPLGLREANLDEKCRLTCEMQNLKDEYDLKTIRTFTAGKFIAPLREHLQTLLKRVSDIDFEERLNRLIMS